MKWSLRFKVWRLTFFSMLSLTQTIEGVTSLIENKGDVFNNTHCVMWDLENTKLSDVILDMHRIQSKHGLGEIMIFGDNVKGSTFNAICFTPTPFRKMLSIVLDTKNVDFLFYKYTVIRGKATIRLTKKIGRGEHKILHIITGKEEPIPPEMEKVIYDTGLSKAGRFLRIG